MVVGYVLGRGNSVDQHWEVRESAYGEMKPFRDIGL